MSRLDRRAVLGNTLTALASAALLGACWRKSELVVQEEGKAFLRVVGDVTGVSLELDGDGARRPLDTEELLEAEVVLLQVLPGRHRVDLYRGGERIVTRDLYFALGQTIELAVPR